jgi:hypothetical protein
VIIEHVRQRIEKKKKKKKKGCARVYNTYDALVCTQFFEKERREREREKKKSRSKAKDEGQRRIFIYIASFTSLRDLPIIIIFSHHI